MLVPKIKFTLFCLLKQFKEMEYTYFIKLIGGR